MLKPRRLWASRLLEAARDALYSSRLPYRSSSCWSELNTQIPILNELIFNNVLRKASQATEFFAQSDRSRGPEWSSLLIAGQSILIMSPLGTNKGCPYSNSTCTGTL